MAPSRSRRSLRTPPRATRAKPVFSYAEPSSDAEIDEDYEEAEPGPSRSPSITKRQFPSRPLKPPTLAKKRYRPINLDSDDEIKRESRSKKRKQSKSSTPKTCE